LNTESSVHKRVRRIIPASWQYASLATSQGKDIRLSASRTGCDPIRPVANDGYRAMQLTRSPFRCVFFRALL